MKNNKRAQTTIFIIIAIVIVALAVLIYVFYPSIKDTLGFEEQNPRQFIQSCLEQDIQDSVEQLSLQGGKIKPQHYIVYNGENIEYLCYTNEFYEKCIMQEPMLQETIEKEIQQNIKDKISFCFDELEKNYRQQGYEVTLRPGSSELELLPKRIVANFNTSLSLTKGDSSEQYGSFRVVLYNNLYELVSVTHSILNWEARYGDAETTTYMSYYRDLKVEKKKQTEGSTIYILTDRNNGFSFQFASRSMPWPPGY